MIGQLLREAVRALWRHKVRSGLSSLGIMVGVAAVVLVVGLGEAGSARAMEQLQALGDNLVWVEAGSRNVAGVRTGSHGATSLTMADAEAIAREVPLIHRVSPQVDGTVGMASAEQNWTTRYRGETPDYLAIKRWSVVLGLLLERGRRADGEQGAVGADGAREAVRQRESGRRVGAHSTPLLRGRRGARRQGRQR